MKRNRQVKVTTDILNCWETSIKIIALAIERGDETLFGGVTPAETLKNIAEGIAMTRRAIDIRKIS